MRLGALYASALIGWLAIAGPALAKSGAKWGYEGASGPKHWSRLSPDYALCDSGHLQSPIDISGGVGTRFRPLSFNYPKPPSRVTNTGHTIQLDFAPGNIFRSGNKTYALLQIHLHSPSEHSIDGHHFPMEIHLLHRAEDRSLAVVAVLVTKGAHHMGLHRMQAMMPNSPGSARKLTHTQISADGFLPADRDFVRYEGSLTTPPCSENVQWHVMSEPIEASQHQFDAFLNLIGENARPVQRPSNRLVLSSSKSVSSEHGPHATPDH